MKIAIPVTEQEVGGPGESREIVVVDTEMDYSVTERYENPALTATSARGISMIRSAVDREASAMIVAHIGSHAFSYVRGRIRLYSGIGLTLDEALAGFKAGTLEEITEELPGNHHHH